MPEVTIEVGGRSYRIGCGAGEEKHLTSLANRLDFEANKLTSQLGQMTEGRLMLMTALMMADQVEEARAAATAAEKRAAENSSAIDAGDDAPAHEAAASLSPEREEKIAASLDDLSARIETLVGRIEGRA